MQREGLGVVLMQCLNSAFAARCYLQSPCYAWSKWSTPITSTEEERKPKPHELSRWKLNTAVWDKKPQNLDSWLACSAITTETHLIWSNPFEENSQGCTLDYLTPSEFGHRLQQDKDFIPKWVFVTESEISLPTGEGGTLLADTFHQHRSAKGAPAVTGIQTKWDGNTSVITTFLYCTATFLRAQDSKSQGSGPGHTPACNMFTSWFTNPSHDSKRLLPHGGTTWAEVTFLQHCSQGCYSRSGATSMF